MCHETNQRCAAHVLYLQSISKDVERCRRLQRLIARRRELPLTEYGAGYLDALGVILLMLSEPETVANYEWCDNPPAGSES
jgi:hypothetical protein